LFPFNDIIDADDGILKLVNSRSSYEIIASGHHATHSSQAVEINMQFLQNPALFRALIRIMKERNRENRYTHTATSDIEMAASNHPLAPPPKEALRAMYVQLKRENDQLEASMKRPEDSIAQRAHIPNSAYN
jgi:hypothetical protein